MKVLSTLICLSLSAVVSARVGAQSVVPRPHHATNTSIPAQASAYTVEDISQVTRIMPRLVFSNNEIQVESLMNESLGYKIYDQLGTVVLDGTIDKTHPTISIANLTADKYYLQLLDESIRTQVFIKG